jgi:transglutaminase-like putative cysteine protease
MNALTRMQLQARPLDLPEPKVTHLAGWGNMSDPARVAFLRSVAEPAGRDPRIRALAAQILSQAGVDQRQYEQQAAVLLRWVQQNIAYLNEPGETLQDPNYTLRVKHGDCDDMAILLAALYESIRLPWKFVLAGSIPSTRERVRWVEGQPFPRGAVMGHIYLAVGFPVFRPQRWTFVEPTVKGAPLGHDVTAPAQSAQVPGGGLPELGAWGATGVAPSTQSAMKAGVLVTAQSAGLDEAREETAVEPFFSEKQIRSIVVTGITGALATVVSAMLLEWFHGKRNK